MFRSSAPQSWLKKDLQINRKLGRLNIYVNQLLIIKNDHRVINRVIDIL